MLNFLERVELQFRCLVLRGAGAMEPGELQVVLKALTNKSPVPPDRGWLLRSYLAGCRLEAQFEP